MTPEFSARQCCRRTEKTDNKFKISCGADTIVSAPFSLSSFKSRNPHKTPTVYAPRFLPVCISTPVSPMYMHSLGCTPISPSTASAPDGSGFIFIPSICPWHTSISSFPRNSLTAPRAAKSGLLDITPRFIPRSLSSASISVIPSYGAV